MQVISSKDNETIKYIKKLKEKKYRGNKLLYYRRNKVSKRGNRRKCKN